MHDPHDVTIVMCLDSRNHAFGKKRLRMVLLDEQGKLGILVAPVRTVGDLRSASWRE